MTMLVAERHRLRRASRSVDPSIQSHIGWLERELKDLDKDLRSALRLSLRLELLWYRNPSLLVRRPFMVV